MACLTEELIASFLESALTAGEEAELEAHVDGCVSCRRLLSEAARAMMHDEAPGDLAGEGVSALGRYRLLERLGAGGMGVVWAGYDPDLDRPVAIKVVKASSDDRGEHLLAEARLMARLSHPNVVPIFDVGRNGAELFLVMERVEGCTLGTWLAQTKRSWRAVVEVFVQVGNGLAAAHETGMVHGDVKPQNVLIRSDGRVGVTDFGLARMLDPATSTGSPAGRQSGVGGTPAYLAPEQYLGEPLDARADQFSFCVALYEALYGERPFVGTGARELAREVLAGRVRPPPPTSTVPARLRRTILRGLSAAPDARFQSMGELLVALQLHTRRRVWLTAAVSSGAVLLAVFAALWTGRPSPARQCEQTGEGLETWSSRKGEVRAAFERTGLSFADDTWTRVEALLDTYVEDWNAARRSACEATFVHHTASQEALGLRLACLARRSSELAALVALLTQTDAQLLPHAVEATRALTEIASCQRSAPAPQLGLPTATPIGPGNEAAVDAVRQLIVRGRIRQHAGRLDEALPMAERAADEARALRHRALEAESALLLGSVLADLGNAEPAFENLKAATFAAEASQQDEIKLRAEIQLVYLIGCIQRRHEDGLEQARRARATLERLGSSPTEEAALEANLANIYSQQGKIREALAHDLRALALLESAGSPRARSLSGLLNNLASSYLSIGEPAEAARHARRAVALDEKLLGPLHPDLVEPLLNLGAALNVGGAYDESLAHHQRAVRIASAALGAEHPRAVLASSALGETHQARGELPQALDCFRRNLAVLEQRVGPAHPDTAAALVALGSAMLDAGRLAEADAHLTRGLALQRQGLTPAHPDLLTTLTRVGALRQRQGRLPEAARAYEEALRAAEDSLGREHPLLLLPLLGLGTVRLALREPTVAVRPLERALTFAERGLGDTLEHIAIRARLSRALVESRGDRARAMQLAGQAQRDCLQPAPPARRSREAECRALARWTVEAQRASPRAGRPGLPPASGGRP